MSNGKPSVSPGIIYFVVLVIIEQKFEQMGPKKCQMNPDNSSDKNIPDADSKKIIQSERFCLLL